MRKADLINKIAEKTNIPKVDVLVTLETIFKEIKSTLAKLLNGFLSVAYSNEKSIPTI